MAAKSHRALKITSIVIGAIVAVALIAVVALNIYMRVAFAPFFDRAESPFDIPGINTGFVPQDLDHVEADDSWLFSGYMADHSPSPLYRRAADPTRPGRFATVPDNVFSIPGMVQGTCTTDDGRIVLSVSYGIAPSHLLAYNVNLAAPDGTFTTGSGDEVELFCLDSRNLTEDLVGPPMQEGIESHDGRVYTTDESASNKYIFGKLCGAGRVYAVQL